MAGLRQAVVVVVAELGVGRVAPGALQPLLRWRRHRHRSAAAAAAVLDFGRGVVGRHDDLEFVRLGFLEREGIEKREVVASCN